MTEEKIKRCSECSAELTFEEEEMKRKFLGMCNKCLKDYRIKK